MYVNHVHTWCPQSSEVAVLSCLRAIMYVDAGNPTKIQGELLLTPESSPSTLPCRPHPPVLFLSFYGFLKHGFSVALAVLELTV